MSYRDKLRLMIVLLLALSVGLSGAWLITSSFDGALEREVTAAQTEQRMALYMLAAGGREDDAETLAAAVRTLERQTGQPFRLTGVDGAVLYEQARGSGFQGGLTAQAAADTMVWRIQEVADGSHAIQIAGALSGEGGTLYLEALRPVLRMCTVPGTIWRAASAGCCSRSP